MYDIYCVILHIYMEREREHKRYLLQGSDLHNCGGWLGELEIQRTGGRLDPLGQDRPLQTQVEFLLLQGDLSFAIRPFAGWKRPTHSMEGNLLCLKPPDCGH